MMDSKNYYTGQPQYFTEEMFKDIYNKHVLDFQSQWKPGTIVFYDINEKSLCTFDEITEDGSDMTVIYDKNSYLPVGVVIDARCGIGDELTLLTHFFVHDEINISDDKSFKTKSGNGLFKRIKDLLNEEVKTFSKKYSKELKFEVIKEDELRMIAKNNPLDILDGLRTYKGLIMNNPLSFDDIIMEGIIVCQSSNSENNDDAENHNDSVLSVVLGAVGPDVTADNFLKREYEQIAANNSYNKFSPEEFFSMTSSEFPKVIYADEEAVANNKADFKDNSKHESYMKILTYKELLERFGTDFIFEYFVPVVVNVKLS